MQKKLTAIHEDNNINELLLGSIQEQINYHQNSTLRLPKGLYLGYLKMQSSVDQIQIVVPAKTPNILPHCKIRDNCHISAEEWKFLKRNKIAACTYELPSDRPTGVQELFLDSLTHAAHRLFKYMDIPPEEALTHRLYDYEVIELSAEVSFLIVCPRAESSCAVPGQREILLQRGDLLSLPLQAFEMIHLKTYQGGIIQVCYIAFIGCRLSSNTLSNTLLTISITEILEAVLHSGIGYNSGQSFASRSILNQRSTNGQRAFGQITRAYAKSEYGMEGYSMANGCHRFCQRPC